MNSNSYVIDHLLLLQEVQILFYNEKNVRNETKVR